MIEMKNSGIEWIGEIPAAWQVSKIKYFFDCLDGKRVPVDAGERISGPYPYWGAGSVTDYVNDYLFDEELILLGEDGAPFFDYTRPVAFLVNEKIWVNNHIHVLKPHRSVCPSYLVHYLNNVDYKTYINGSILNKLTQSNMNTIAFVVPPYEEQVRIAAFLDRKCTEIDAVIERTKATIEEYRKLRQAIVTDAVTKGVRGERALKDTGVEWIRIVPVDWEMVRGKGLFVETNTRSTTGEEELLTVSQYTGVTPRSQKNVNMFEAESLEGYKICKLGDIAANTMWLWAGAIGVSEYEGVISPSYNLYRQSGENYNPKYLDYLLRCTPLVQCYESMSTGIRASRLRLYPQQFLSIKFPVPPMAEQVEIVVYLDKKCAEMDALIARKTALLTEMESYKKSVIYEYVTGKKEVS